MAAVPSKNNRSTEQKLKSLLRRSKVSGWRTQWPVKGTPDFAWPKLRVAVFVDGCFWHGCWRCYKLPKTRRVYWSAKHRANKLRRFTIHRASLPLSLRWSLKIFSASILRSSKRSSGNQGAKIAFGGFCIIP
ncbi:MAG: very short patch repair endonuclease [Deltaproteobacteria bacterium]|nr:very short patch repair endonuclease [Deltaproteobacteria bacterium]